jgi:hypothetical protein
MEVVVQNLDLLAIYKFVNLLEAFSFARFQRPRHHGIPDLLLMGPVCSSVTSPPNIVVGAEKLNRVPSGTMGDIGELLADNVN